MEWQIHSPQIEVSPKIPIDELRTSLRQSITEVTQILTFLRDEVAEKEAKAKQFKAELVFKHQRNIYIFVVNIPSLNTTNQSNFDSTQSMLFRNR